MSLNCGRPERPNTTRSFPGSDGYPGWHGPYRERHLGSGNERGSHRHDGGRGPGPRHPIGPHRRSVRRAAGAGGRSGLLHPLGERRDERRRGRHSGPPVGHAADDRPAGGPHPPDRRFRHRRDGIRHSPGRDPGLRPRRSWLPTGLARRHRGVRDRPAAGDGLQDGDAGRRGRRAHRRPAGSADRSARRLARGAATGRLGHPAARPYGSPKACWHSCRRKPRIACWTTSPSSARRAAGWSWRSS